MLKLKEIQTKPVIYQGLEVNVPVNTNFMWLRHTDAKTELWASPKKPVWGTVHKLYIPSSDATVVAVLEHADLTEEQVKNSLETDESLPTDQDLKKIGVVNNLIKNLYGFAKSLERNVDKAMLDPSSENIHSLLEHVYADEGELDTFYDRAIKEATDFGILADQDEESEEDLEILVKLLSAMCK